MTTANNQRVPSATISARYGFKEPRSREIQRPDDPLYSAMGKWLDSLPETDFSEMIIYYDTGKDVKEIQKLYVAAANSLQRLPKRSTQELHSATLCFKAHPKANRIGLFLSAGYNSSSESDIEFDIDMDVDPDFLGYMLPKGKRLFIRSDTGKFLGMRSNGGSFYNFGSVRGVFGYESKGDFANYGKTAELANDCTGRILNRGEAGSICPRYGKTSKIVNFGKVHGVINTVGFCANFGEADIIYAEDESTAVNFGTINSNMETRGSACIINAGVIMGEMGVDAENSSIVVALKDPGILHITDALICMDEDHCSRLSELNEYFNRLKGRIESCRDDGTDNFHRVFSALRGADSIPKNVAKLSGRREILKYLW